MKQCKFLTLLLAVLFVASCNPFGLAPTPKPTPVESITAYTFIEEMEAALVLSPVLSANYASQVADGARSLVVTDTTDVELVMDKIIDGAITAIGDIGELSAEERLAVIDVILTSIMESLDEHKSDVLESSRAIDSFAISMEQILRQISAAAIRNLSNAGLESSELADGAKSTMTTLITALDNGGVQASEVPSVIQVITRAAVENIVENTGASEGSVIRSATKSITEGAVSAIDNIEVEGFNAEQVPEVIGGITAGATQAIEQIADDISIGTSAAETVTAIKELTSDITSSALSGADSLEMINSGNIAEVVEKVTKSAINAVSEIRITGIETKTNNADTRAIIGQITESTSNSAGKMVRLDEADRQSVLTAVVTGASDGAQSIDASFDQAALESAIRIDEDGDDSTASVAVIEIQDEGLKTFLQDAVTDGIEKADNTPPASDAGENKTAQVLEDVTLDGSGSTDPDEGDAIIEYFWFIAGSPDNSTEAQLVQDDTSVSAAIFTADVPGEYTLGLKVTDGRGDYNTNYMKVEVAIPATALTYEGKTAQERLDAAIILREEGDPATALSEFRKILTYYPETAVFAEAYLQSGYCYDNMNKRQEAFAEYQKVVTLYPSSDSYPKAKLSQAWSYQWYFRDTELQNLAAAKTIFEELSASPYTNTKYHASAVSGMGFNHMMKNEWTEARAKFTEALAIPGIDNNERFWTKFHYAETYRWADEAATAITEWNKIFDSSANTLDDDGVTDYWKIQQTHDAIAWAKWDVSGLAEAKAEWMKIIDNVNMPDQYKGTAWKNIGGRYRTTGNNEETLSGAITYYEQAETAFKTAYTLCLPENPNQAYWSYGDLLWMYKDWMRALINEGQSEAGIYTKFMTVRSTVLAGPSEFAPQKITAYMSYGDYYAWDKEVQNKDLAIASAEAALELAVSRNLDEEAWIRRHLGYFYTDKGWDNRDRVGVNWRAFFYKAIEYAEGITYEKFPGEAWAVGEGQRIVIQAYNGLRAYTVAIDKAEEIISSPPDYFEKEGLAEIHETLVDCYRSKANDYRNRDYWNEALTVFDQAITVGEAALVDGVYSESDFENSEDYLRIMDRIRINVGDAYMEKGWIYRDDAEDDVLADEAFNGAISVYDEITPNTEEWYYYNSQRNMAECQLGMELYADARSTLSNILDNIVDEFDPDERGRILVDLADTYKNEIDDYDEEATDYETHLTTLFDAGIIAFDDAIGDVSMTNEYLLRAYRNKGSLIYRYACELYWNNIEFIAYIDDAIDEFELGTAVEEADNFDDWGRDVSDCWREIGEANRDKYHSEGQRLDWDETWRRSTGKDYLIEALGAYKNAVDEETWGALWLDDVLETKQRIAECDFDLMHIYDFETEFEILKPYLEEGFTYCFDVIGNPDVREENAVECMVNLAELNGTFDGQTITVDGDDYDLSFEEALFWCNTIISSYSHIENGFYAARAQRGIGQVYKADGDFEKNGDPQDLDTAISSYSTAITAFEKVEPDYPEIDDDDDWIYRETRNDLYNTRFERADTYINRNGTGDFALGIADYQWLIDNILNEDYSYNQRLTDAYMSIGYAYMNVSGHEDDAQAIDAFTWVVNNCDDGNRQTEAQDRINEINA
ncbi:MAG: tetratricopeptide repeat protein [Spirochaetales bacterium]|nr:tetratricopeptide repeat protein [Spirochaetales bacterium]